MTADARSAHDIAADPSDLRIAADIVRATADRPAAADSLRMVADRLEALADRREAEQAVLDALSEADLRDAAKAQSERPSMDWRHRDARVARLDAAADAVRSYQQALRGET